MTNIVSAQTEYEDEITFVAEMIIKVGGTDHATIFTAAYSAAYLLGYELQREATNDLVNAAIIEAEFIRKHFTSKD